MRGIISWYLIKMFNTIYYIFRICIFPISLKHKALIVFNSDLLLSHFSRVRLCATPWTAAHQASPSLGFSRQEHWSGLPFPSPVHENEKWKWSCSVVSDSSDPMDCSPPGSSVHGIFQARVLEWRAISLVNLIFSSIVFLWNSWMCQDTI